ncbi:MAG: hypothetical protein KDA72_14855 [Planctomycetales bacterium]|nr:hypothetical protein [Planctomycetales bacterium]
MTNPFSYGGVVGNGEFQQITAYEDGVAERQIRSSIQHHYRVAYIFLGSRKHLLQSMFLDESRPLYRSAMHYPIGSIKTKHWLPFIAQRFRDANKAIDKQLIEQLCELHASLRPACCLERSACSRVAGSSRHNRARRVLVCYH